LIDCLRKKLNMNIIQKIDEYFGNNRKD